jgi:hypothetical protein
MVEHDAQPTHHPRGRFHHTRKRVAMLCVAVLALAYSLVTGGVPGVGAVFTSETENQNAVVQGSWIPGPSGLSDKINGSNDDQVKLNWTSGHTAAAPSPNPVTGQTILEADGGSGGSASCGSYSVLTTVAQGASTTTDTGITSPDWRCYEVESTSNGSWTSDAVAFDPVQLLIPESVVLGNGGGTLGTAEAGDTITITYNQAVTGSGTLAVHVCHTQSSIMIGAGCTGNPSIGEIDGVTVSANNNFSTSTYSASGSTVVVTLEGTGTATVSGNGPYTASGAKITSTNGGWDVCSSAGCNTVSSTGSF